MSAVGSISTDMPQIGSTAVAGGAAAHERGVVLDWRRTSMIEARIDNAISAGVRAPMSSPAGVSIRPSNSSDTPSSRSMSSTAVPRRRLATRPT